MFSSLSVAALLYALQKLEEFLLPETARTAAAPPNRTHARKTHAPLNTTTHHTCASKQASKDSCKNRRATRARTTSSSVSAVPECRERLLPAAACSSVIRPPPHTITFRRSTAGSTEPTTTASPLLPFGSSEQRPWRVCVVIETTPRAPHARLSLFVCVGFFRCVRCVPPCTIYRSSSLRRTGIPACRSRA